MIILGDIAVYPNFDSGDFMNTFVVMKNTESWEQAEQNIQKAHNLDSDDFKALSLLIAGVVKGYLSSNKTIKNIFADKE